MTNSNNFNWDAFSHGQIISKQWCCDHLIKHLHDRSNLAICGGWYNVLGMMIKLRGYTGQITSFDIDPSVKSVADRITDAWVITGTMTNVVSDVCQQDLSYFDVVVNTSTEHMSSQWFHWVKAGTVVCCQTSDLDIPHEPWLITNPTKDLESFVTKFPLRKLWFADSLRIDYENWGYIRHMIIGEK